MVYSSDEFDDDLLSIKQLLERYGPDSAQSQKENTAPPDLFDPVTPPKALQKKVKTSKTTAEEAKPHGTSKKGAVLVGETKTPATVIRKQSTLSKGGKENAKETKENPVLMVKSWKGRNALPEATSTVEKTARKDVNKRTKGVLASNREVNSAKASSTASYDSDFEEETSNRMRTLQPPATVRKARRTVLDSDDESTLSGENEEKTERLDVRLQRLAIDLTLSDSEDDFCEKNPSSPIRQGNIASEEEGFESQDSKSSIKIPVGALLSYSPPRSTKPCKVLQPTGQALVPNSPASPKKRGARIPPSPHRLSSDLFWDQGETNAWIDAHSPQKKPGVQRALFQASEEDISEEGGGEEPPLSPTKNSSKEKRVTKKAFDAKKKGLAEEFLKTVDDKIGKGEVARKCADTGGVRVVWSKSLRTTAGTARWKMEKLRAANGQAMMDDGASAERARHHATIELSEKVIDCEEKLYNVLCHEYCHLANYIISNVRKPPHGQEFKRWASLCTRAFSSLNVHVTTTHSYEIECKYQWACQAPGCGYIYKRHSQSINPSTHTCGSCKGGKLVQTHPPPQEKRAITGYQAFVKANFSRITAENPGTPQKGMMSIVARQYKESKAGSDVEKGKRFVEAGEKEGELEELLSGLKV